MGCNSLLEATNVTADGEEVTLKDSSNPKLDQNRLFRAFRGAGGGNLSVCCRRAQDEGSKAAE